MCKTKYFISMLFFGLFSLAAQSQHLNVKTNVLYDATATINLGVEMGLGKKTSLDISGNYNPWTFSNNRKWKHWLVQPEFRYWLCERFNGHFFGIHALGGQFNFNHVKLPFDLYQGLNDYNYQGDFIGAGLSYGYQWMLGKRWGLEATLGVGYIYVKYDRYSCATCGTKLEEGTENYFGPTKAGITLIYFIY